MQVTQTHRNTSAGSAGGRRSETIIPTHMRLYSPLPY
nr:MAG TPA: hypothetical protein [Caudoviricetes sp.]